MPFKRALTGKNALLYLGFFALIVILVEFLVFNPNYLTGKFSGSHEIELKIANGDLNQFRLEDGKLISLGNDPNLTFNNVNVGVNSVLIECNNVAPHANAQVFYRARDEDFSEERSVRYDPASDDKKINLPLRPIVYSLRLDLTDIEKDIVTCSEITINPVSVFFMKSSRLWIYLILLLAVVLYSARDNALFRKFFGALSSVVNNILAYAEPNKITNWLDALILEAKTYFLHNTAVIISLIFVAVFSYGFELFNFNLTIDEEFHAALLPATSGWADQGRWGMYFLNVLFLPHTVIPFVPLFLALVFHLTAVLLLLKSWDVRSNLAKIIAGSVCVAFPIISYMYTFSTINYGIGAGLFCVSLSLFLFLKLKGGFRLFAVIPATFSVGIYQGFFPALIAVYLVYVILRWIRSGSPKIIDLLMIAAIHVFAVVCYEIVQKLTLKFVNLQETDYVSQYIDLISIRENLWEILTRILHTILLVYSGDASLYGIKIVYLGLFFLILYFGFILKVGRSDLLVRTKLFLIFLGSGLLLLPFLSGLILQGYLAMRFLVALPIVVMGLVVLGMDNNFRLYNILTALLAVFCVFQFIVSTNYLFGSSHLALQADRAFATQLIERIEQEKLISGISNVQYFEVVGYYSRPSTALIPKLETFGASFFEWDGGSPDRILMFMQTLGYYGLGTTPVDERVQLIEVVNAMPSWPAKGSVKIINNVVVLKFGPYSNVQRTKMCDLINAKNLIKYRKFCE